MTKKILECEYCHQIITENDLKCPNCGASCSEIIKKYKEEQIALEKELQAKKEEENTKKRKLIEKTLKNVTRFHLISFIIATIIALAIIAICIFVFTKIITNMQNTETNSLKETTTLTTTSDNYKITVDSYEEYAYYDDFFKDKCNTKDGYQKIAFYFTIENISNDTVSTLNIINNISLKADNLIVSQSNLTENANFCELIQGTNNYSKLTQTTLTPKDSVSGYLGFEVPTNAKKLKFTIDDITIEMDNPAYSET